MFYGCERPLLILKKSKDKFENPTLFLINIYMNTITSDLSDRETEKLMAFVRQHNETPFHKVRRPRSQRINRLACRVSSWLDRKGIASGKKEVPANELYTKFCEDLRHEGEVIPTMTAFGLAAQDRLKKGRKNFGIVYLLNKNWK